VARTQLFGHIFTLQVKTFGKRPAATVGGGQSPCKRSGEKRWLIRTTCGPSRPSREVEAAVEFGTLDMVRMEMNVGNSISLPAHRS
jgi:hypothetical protein